MIQMVEHRFKIGNGTGYFERAVGMRNANALTSAAVREKAELELKFDESIPLGSEEVGRAEYIFLLTF